LSGEKNDRRGIVQGGKKTGGKLSVISQEGELFVNINKPLVLLLIFAMTTDTLHKKKKLIF